MAVTKYIMISDSEVNQNVKKGDTVYALAKSDYGLSRDDTNYTGVVHVSVTLDADGGYPSFTVPQTDLKKVCETSGNGIIEKLKYLQAKYHKDVKTYNYIDVIIQEVLRLQEKEWMYDELGH